MPLDPAETMTVQEVAALFRVTDEAVRQWADAGKLASFRTPGRRLRFRRADVEAFLPAEVEVA